MAVAHQVEGDVGEVMAFARAELERVARDLAAGRESRLTEHAPARAEEPFRGSLAALVAERDAQLWSAVGAGGPAHE